MQQVWPPWVDTLILFLYGCAQLWVWKQIKLNVDPINKKMDEAKASFEKQFSDLSLVIESKVNGAVLKFSEELHAMNVSLLALLSASASDRASLRANVDDHSNNIKEIRAELFRRGNA